MQAERRDPWAASISGEILVSRLGLHVLVSWLGATAECSAWAPYIGLFQCKLDSDWLRLSDTETESDSDWLRLSDTETECH